MKARVYFITGVCGVGKSSVIPFLRSSLPIENYQVHDFDERGVHSSNDRNRRFEETKYWLEVGRVNSEHGVSTIICGFANPDEIKNMPEAKDLVVAFVLLDASGEVIRERLEKRNSDPIRFTDLERVTGKSVEDFIAENVAFADTLRKICLNENCFVLDTSTLEIQEVAKQVVEFIL